MTDSTPTPAQETPVRPTQSALDSARTLAARLQTELTNPASSVEDLKAALSPILAQLHGQLDKAAQHGEGADADELRAKIAATVEETAAFSSLMVHEIRKPMTSIRGYTDMLAKPGMIGPLNDTQQQFINTIRNNVMRMEGLVADISDISKLNAGKLRLDNKMTTFGQVVMDVQKQSEAMIAEYGHTVTWDVPQGLPILNTDTKQLAKSVYYLLRNAIQYTPKETGQITVKAERQGENMLHITITDNGIGMKPEEIARLGELFYRADHELVTSEKGYGLGVPIAMGFAKLLGGRFDPVQSEPDKGSTFGFTIPGMG